MKYIVIILLSVVIIDGGCSAQEVNGISNAAEQPWATSTPSPRTAGNECRICSFKYEQYKGELMRAEIDGLLLALNDEYLAVATYEKVNSAFGDPRPFVNIVRSENHHAELLKGLFRKYGVAIPENPWTERVPTFKTVGEACSASVEGEIVNRDLYQRLFGTTTREEILGVYRRLQRASEENHLPAFQRCGEGGGRGPGGGPGMRRSNEPTI